MNIINDAEKIGIKLITLSGTGEIFVYRGIETVLRSFIENSLNLMVFSNGAAISDESIEYLVRANAIINLSVNSGDRESYLKVHGKDDYDVVCSTMRKLKQSAVKYGTMPVLGCSFIVVPANISTIRAAAQKARLHGFDFITFKPATKINSVPNFTEIERLVMVEQIKEAKGFSDSTFRVNVNFDPLEYYIPYKHPGPSSPRCFQGLFSINISSDGGIYPCSTEATMRINMTVPNIKDMSLKQFIETDYYKNFYRKDFRNDFHHSGCFNNSFNLFINWLYEIIGKNNDASFAYALLPKN